MGWQALPSVVFLKDEEVSHASVELHTCRKIMRISGVEPRKIQGNYFTKEISHFGAKFKKFDKSLRLSENYRQNLRNFTRSFRIFPDVPSFPWSRKISQNREELSRGDLVSIGDGN